MTETIEQAARSYANITHNRPLDEEERYYKDYQKYDGFLAGATYQSSQPNPHRIKEAHIFELEWLYYHDKITHSRMVEILNEIAEGKHKERIEL
jgi:hypothetical protein